MQPNFSLENSETFNTVFPWSQIESARQNQAGVARQSSKLLQEKVRLSTYSFTPLTLVLLNRWIYRIILPCQLHCFWSLLTIGGFKGTHIWNDCLGGSSKWTHFGSCTGSMGGPIDSLRWMVISRSESACRIFSCYAQHVRKWHPDISVFSRTRV